MLPWCFEPPGCDQIAALSLQTWLHCWTKCRESPLCSSKSWKIPFTTVRAQTDVLNIPPKVLVLRVRWDTCQVKLSSEMLRDVLVSPLQVRLLHLHVSPWQLPPDGVAHIWQEEEKKARLWIHVPGSVSIVKLRQQSTPAAVIERKRRGHRVLLHLLPGRRILL